MAMDPQEQQNRWDAWINLAKMAMVPNFTERGWALTEAPKALHQELYDALHAGMGTDAEVLEADSMDSKEIEVRGMATMFLSEKDPGRPTFVRAEALMAKVLRELQPMHEAWGGVPLLPSSAYGLRVYKNLSSLLMHIDKTESHVISSILHVDHKYDNDAVPWPIELEDLDGRVQRLDLKPGQMLFYESAKCLHGRPTVLRGSFYVSIFTHYRPVGWNMAVSDAESMIPPHWRDNIALHPHLQDIAARLPALRAAGTGLIDLNASRFTSVVETDAFDGMPEFGLQRVTFKNSDGTPIEAFWVDARGTETHVGVVPPQGQLGQATFHGHRFRFKQGDATLAEHVIDTLQADFHRVTISGARNEL